MAGRSPRWPCAEWGRACSTRRAQTSTVAALDFSVSKRFGVASTLNLTPYTGYQLGLDPGRLRSSGDARHRCHRRVGGQGRQRPAPADPLRGDRLQGRLSPSRTSRPSPRAIDFFGVEANFYILSLIAEYTFFASGSPRSRVRRRDRHPVRGCRLRAVPSTRSAGCPRVLRRAGGTRRRSPGSCPSTWLSLRSNQLGPAGLLSLRPG